MKSIEFLDMMINRAYGDGNDKLMTGLKTVKELIVSDIEAMNDTIIKQKTAEIAHLTEIALKMEEINKPVRDWTETGRPRVCTICHMPFTASEHNPVTICKVCA